MNLYHQELMDHYHHPRNKGAVSHAHFSSAALNPSCGDIVSFQGTLHANVIDALGFTGSGCVISQAAASMLSERVKGLSRDQVMSLDNHFMLKILNLSLGPTRLRCATLALEALHRALTEYSQAQA